jgi:hypothetical protein
MGWVMVPVPEELRGEVDALLFRLRMFDAVPGLDPLKMGEHLLSLEAEPRAVLLEVAAAVASGQPIEDRRLAEMFGISAPELLGLVSEANEITVVPFKGRLVFTSREPDAAHPETTTRQLHMMDGYAQMIMEQAEQLGLERATPASSE